LLRRALWPTRPVCRALRPAHQPAEFFYPAGAE